MKRLLTAFLLFFVALSAAGPVLAQRVDPEVLMARQLTADQGLFLALAKNDLSTMIVLRDQGADPNITLTRLGLNPKKVFDKKLPIFKQQLDPAGWPILTWAVYLDNLEAVKILLRSGARINAPDVYGATALHWAAWSGNHQLAKILLNNGANCRATDIKKRTPKDWAIMMGHNDLVRLLDSRTCRPAPIKDSDMDGVPDDRDLCPNTPFGAPVDDRGCWVVAYANFFDFDKSVVKQQYIPHLVDAAAVLKNYPDLMVEIQGHTDAIGTEEYNMKLGLRRAEAVKNILVKNGVSSNRLHVSSKGKSQPIADNSSPSGRARNRRVEIHVAQPGALTSVAPTSAAKVESAAPVTYSKAKPEKKNK